MGKSKNTKLLILINTYVPQGFSNNKFESQVIDKKKRPFPPMHSYLKKKSTVHKTMFWLISLLDTLCGYNICSLAKLIFGNSFWK